MTGRTLPAITAVIAAASLALAACAHSSPPRSPEAPMPTASSSSLRMMPVKEWPLRFDHHGFSAYCYDTYACRVWYANRWQAIDDDVVLQRSSASYAPDYQRGWSGGHIGIKNFPGPAEVTWRSKDGQAHEATIGIGEIFQDELIHHHVTRDEMGDVPDGEFQNDPAIILEINDRTIRVYMRAHVPTKHLQNPDNRYSDFRNDVVLVRTYTY